MTLALYYYPGNASTLPHMMLHEIGVPFELRLVDRATEAQRDPAYLRINPNGLIPALVDGDAVLFETAAIVLHLVERFPQAGLGPLPGDPSRARFLTWMVHLSNTPQAQYMAWFYPQKYAGDPGGMDTVKQGARVRLERMFELIAAQLGEGPYLLGERFSAADLFLFMLVQWGRNMPRPPRAHPALAAHAARIWARPAVRATFDAEGITAEGY
jgi:glutathione S-transferase